MNLNQLTIPSLDVSKAIVFYQTLGLKLIVKDLPNYARLRCLEGDTTLSIHLVDKLPLGQGVQIYFECNNLDEQVNKLKQNGVAFEAFPTDKTWLWREARLKDLDNNQLILYFAGENRLNPPWKIKEG